MIRNESSELSVNSEQKNEIDYSGNFIHNPKNFEIIKEALDNLDDVKDNILYYSDKIRCFPSIVHFSGFNVNTTQKQFLRIVNKGKKKIRINVQPPETPYFSIEHKKKGYIIPEMSEDVLISFTPTHWKYYYDSIKIVGPDINVVVPLHGYPVLTNIDFPKRINFGQVPLAYTKRKTIPITCNIPIDFEFKIEIIEPSPFFSIYPLKGVIPALHSIDIVIEYKPCSYRSSHLSFQIEISQFNFKPHKVKVFGTCKPNILLDKTNELIRQVFGKKDDKYGNDDDDYDTSLEIIENNDIIINKNEYLNKDNTDIDENNNNNKTSINTSDNNNNDEIIENENTNSNNNKTFSTNINNENNNDNNDNNDDNKDADNNDNENINNNDNNNNEDNKDNQENLPKSRNLVENKQSSVNSYNKSKKALNNKTMTDQEEADLFILNFKKRKQYEKYKEMHRFICVGEDIPEEDNNSNLPKRIATFSNVLKDDTEINYETIRRSKKIFVERNIGDYYFFENDNYKKDWESKERIVKKFLRLHYKNIYQIRANKMLECFRKWKIDYDINLNNPERIEELKREERKSFTKSIFEPINEQEKSYIEKLNKNDENMKFFLPHSIIFDESHPFRKPYPTNPIEINHIPLWNPIPFQEPLEYQLLNYQPQPDISISEYLFSNVNQNIVDETEEIKIVKRSKQYTIPEMPNKIIESCFIPLEIYNPHQYARNSIYYWNSKINKNIEFEMFKTPVDTLEEISRDSNIMKFTRRNLYISRNMIQNEDVKVSFYLDNKLCVEQNNIEKHTALLTQIWKDIRDETKEREEKKERKRLNKIKLINRYKKLQISPLGKERQINI